MQNVFFLTPQLQQTAPCSLPQLPEIVEQSAMQVVTWIVNLMYSVEYIKYTLAAYSFEYGNLVFRISFPLYFLPPLEMRFLWSSWPILGLLVMSHYN